MNPHREGDVGDSPGSNDQSKYNQETLIVRSEPSSVSTTGILSQPSSTIARDRDGSVISAVTDPASIEGPLLPAMVEEEETGSLLGVDNDVPEHVILDERSTPGDSPNGASSEDPVVAFDGTISPPPPVAVNLSEEPEVQIVAQDAREPVTTPTKANTGGNESDDAFENDETNYAQSPALPSEIVERSPGGRYVRFLEKLGSGASKDVYRAYDTEEGIEVAWNVVSLSGVPKAERNRLVNEVRLLERLHHNNIISFHGSWVNREKQEVIFVTEILSSGTLKSFINKVQVIRWKIAKRWALQILKGLEYLHSQDPPVIHRDLKCENIFINGTSGDLRIGDLGLSTVHQNGKMLSVLGTPEFMAPDMYEDKPYDEKVDVYAFGMCLLEIFTKEIPYSECNNPAQIYKKVTRGEPPEVLSRLQSKHARDFVNLCLGYRDEEGSYVRPSVTELLKHAFLLKRENDDDEVVVERPLRERAIPETEVVGTPKITRKVKNDPSKPSGVEGNSDPTKKRPPSIAAPEERKRSTSVAASDDNGNDTDKFEEMPQSETNMRKVTVMMGRNEELKEDDLGGKATVKEMKDIPPDSSKDQQTQALENQRNGSIVAPQNYLVAAVVIENENTNVLPYADGVLKLVITLPVDGQTQDVHFDFNLVDDNPFQVAKEMVEELRIPQAATVEISETISGLAQQARIRLRAHQSAAHASNGQHHPSAPSQMEQQQFHQQAGQGGNHVQNQSIAPQPQDALQTINGGQPVHQTTDSTRDEQNQFFLRQGGAPLPNSGMFNPTSAAPPLSSQAHNHAGPGPNGSQQTQHYHHANGQGTAFQQNSAQLLQQVQKQVGDQGAGHSNYSQDNADSFPVRQMSPDVQPIVGVVPEQKQPSLNPTSYGLTNNVMVSNEDLTSFHHQPAAPPVAAFQTHGAHPTGSGQAAHNIQQPGGGPNSSPDGSQPPRSEQLNQHQVRTVNSVPPVPPSSQTYHQSHISQAGGPSNPRQESRQLVDGQGGLQQQHPVPPKPSSSTVSSHTQSSVTPPLPPPAPNRTEVGARRQSDSNDTLVSIDLPPLSPKVGGHGDSAGHISLRGTSSEDSQLDAVDVTGDADSDDDDEVKEELRKLEEDFQKNIQRARKVFDNRMDNLQRSQFEKEAQHQKTLEKHQKERAEYEKRLAEEEKQQNRRIEQLQKDWDKRRQNLAMQKRKQKNGFHSSSGDVTQDSFLLPPEAEVNHVRSLSSSSSNPSSSPAGATHKIPPESNAGGGPSAPER